MEQSSHFKPKDLGTLAVRGWLSQQPTDFQDRIARLGRFQTVHAGRYIYQVGDVPDALYGLDSGLLDLTVPVGGTNDVTIHRATPGFWIGDSAILAGSVRTISLRTVTECRLFRVRASRLRALLDAHPSDWKCFFMLGHMNISATLAVLAEMSALSPRARFARLLLRMADESGKVHMTQDDLARMAGMSRATFRRSFGGLIERGIVATSYGTMSILDRVALEREGEAA
jgi:CRP/FNR family cyclic AMP-dependent transcriptional regulator